MKVLKQGKGPDETTPWWVGKHGKCSACGTEVEMEADDERELLGYVTETIIEAVCPECKRVITILNRRNVIEDGPGGPLGQEAGG